jgi:hypothetical protein
VVIPELPADFTLCAICRRVFFCTLPRRRNQPLWHCPEFEPCVVPSGIGRSPAEGTDRFADLCSTCATSRRCPFPRLPGGVWHCEAYRERGFS